MEEWQTIIRDMNPDQQYAWFVSQVADMEVAWGLYHQQSEGWAMTQTDEEQELLVLWADPSMAKHHATGLWDSYRAESLDIHGFLEFGIKELESAGRGVSLMYTNKEGGLVVSLMDLKRDVTATLEAYAAEE